MKATKRPPTSKTLCAFMMRWEQAQRSRNVPRMEALLKAKWLNCWWWAMRRESAFQAECLEAVEYILQREGLIGTRPMRASERAMMEADKLAKKREPCGYCGQLDCENPSDCPDRRRHIQEDKEEEKRGLK